MHAALGEEGIRIFRKVFENNNKELIDEFFNDSFIRKVWPTIMKNSRYEYYFKKDPKPELEETFKKISTVMTEKYNLPMPTFWLRKYPLSI